MRGVIIGLITDGLTSQGMAPEIILLQSCVPMQIAFCPKQNQVGFNSPGCPPGVSAQSFDPFAPGALVSYRPVVGSAGAGSGLPLSLLASTSAFAGVSAMPSKDIVETASSAGNFQTLTTALQAAGLVETL